jgi:mRNA interferase MazF
MGMVVKQYDILLINLDPTIGHEIKKVRPCVIISPDEMNGNIETVIIAPMTSRGHAYPTRVPIRFKGKEGWIVLDQIRTVDRKRLIKKLGRLEQETVLNVKSVIQEMLVD